jgi:type I restriction enzyme S subunit
MSAVVSKKKRERRLASQAPVRHSGEGGNTPTSSFRTPRSGDPESSSSVSLKAVALAPLGDVVDINPRFNKDELTDDMLASFVPMKCVEEESGRFVSQEDRKVGEVRKGYTAFRDGDVIFAKVTPCMENGKAAVVDALTNGIGFGSTEFFVLRPSERIDPKYLLHFVLQQSFRKEAARNMTGAVGLRRVTKSWLEQQQVPLPSIAAQRQIVAEIEKQFTRLDAGMAALRRVQVNLKRYRAAVLKAACEGRLVPTEAELAKAEGRTCETGEQLLARILADRRKNWHGRGKYKEPAAPDTTNLPPLPEGWVYTSIDPLLDTNSVGMKTGPFGSLLKKSEHKDSGVPVIGIENIGANGRFVHGSKIYVTTQKAHELAAYELLVGDVVISRSGTVGELCVIPESVGTARFSTNIMMVRLAPWCSSTYFCFLFAGSPIVLDQIKELCKGSTREFLNQHILKSIIFPLPPFAEQLRIVAEVERHLSVIEELEAAFTATLQRATSLRQSVLQRAFSTPATKAHPA